MKLLIDASNLKTGGSMTHLTEILSHLNFGQSGFSIIAIVGGHSIEKFKSNSNFIIIQPNQLLNRNFIRESLWKVISLPRLAKEYDLVFSPGGTFNSKTVRYVTMCRNMLVFQNEEKRRYGLFSFMFLKLSLLKYVQLNSFKKSHGLVFISEYAKQNVMPYLPKELNVTIINHGISNKFANIVKGQKGLENYSFKNPIKLLYVSTIDVYKHHFNLIKAIINLRLRNFPVELTLIGDIYKPAFNKIKTLLKEHSEYIVYEGPQQYDIIQKYYKESDAFVFSSSCENMPNILIEAMAAGLPIACSGMGPMKEFLRDAGFYFNPLQPISIEQTIEIMLRSPEQRSKNALKAQIYSAEYSWQKCSEETFNYIYTIGKS